MFLFLFDIKAESNQNSAEFNEKGVTEQFGVTVGAHYCLQVTQSVRLHLKGISRKCVRFRVRNPLLKEVPGHDFI